MLTGILAGGPIVDGGVGLPGEIRGPMGVSLYLMAIDPTVAMSYDTFTARVDALVDHLQGSPAAPGVDRVRVPGGRSQATARV